MKIAHNLTDFLSYRSALSSTVSFVPTMGNLHQGHLNLITLAKKHSTSCISSIFVNPAQFSPSEDFSKYPRTFESDIEKLKNYGVSLLFSPQNSDLYNKNHLMRVCISKVPGSNPLRNDEYNNEPENWLEEQPESIKRPAFFDGVSTILVKLFNLCRPDVVVFGQKDAVQCIVVKQILRDLNYNCKLVIGDIEREKDGLAMSSRNQYLSSEDRMLFGGLMNKNLLNISKKYNEIRSDFNNQLVEFIVKYCYFGLEINFNEIIEKKKENFEKDLYNIEYVSLCDSELGQVYGTYWGNDGYQAGKSEIKKENKTNPKFLSMVVKVGGTRLLDNIILK